MDDEDSTLFAIKFGKIGAVAEAARFCVTPAAARVDPA